MTRAGVRAVRAMAPLVALLLGAGALAGCGGSPASLGPAGVDQLTIPTPSPAPADFGGSTQNVWFPLETGTRWVYRQYGPTGNRRVVATVEPGRPRIQGVTTTPVLWRVQTSRGLATAMVRWYAVDRSGNVWWFGQRVTRPGAMLDRLAPRSWRAGTSGAEAGLVLTATPRDGDGYLNGFQPRVVARRSTVMSLDGRVATVRRAYPHSVVTHDLSSLVPLHQVQTFFSRGLGMVAQNDTMSTTTSLALMRMSHG